MARIAVIVSNPCVADARVIKMAESAAKIGHDVHVFGTIGAGSKLYELKSGVTYHRLEWRPAQLILEKLPISLIKKINRKFAIAIAKKLTPFFKYNLFHDVFSESIEKIEPEIIHAHDLICLPVAYKVAKETGAKVVYDAHELEIHRNPPLPLFEKKWVAYNEYKYGSKASAVNTVGQLVGNELSHHIKRDDINIIYNSPVVNECTRNIRKDLRLSKDVPLLIYVGKVTIGRGVSEILEILPKMDGVHFAAIGPCDEMSRKKIEQRASRLKISSRFRILPSVPYDQVVSYIRGSNLGIISVEPITLSYQYCMPNKLFELSFADVPILSNKLDEIEMFIDEIGNGEVVDFDNLASLPYVIVRMINNQKDYRIDEESKLVLYEKYSWIAQANKLKTIYESL